MTPVHESEILKKLDPAIKDDEDQWPQFPLRDVTITSQKTGREISLFQAHKKGKVRVTGTLHDQDADPDSRKRFLKRFQKGQQVFIKDVDMYSYGKYEDGSLAFWAAGEAGWFELRTVANAYKAMYAEMMEAAEMLYFLIGRVQRQRKDFRKAPTKTIHDNMRAVFTAFLNDEGLNKRRTDMHDCIDGFTEHRHFLIKCMLEGAEGYDWGRTVYLRWYEITLPQDFALVQNIVNQTPNATYESPDAGPAAPVTPAPAMRVREKSTDTEMEVDNNKPVGRRSRRLAAAAAADEASSSEELTARRGPARGKNKRISMLRVPGSAKTPKKTHVRRVDAPSSIRDPQMDYFREMRRLDDIEAPYPKPEAIEEEENLDAGLVRDLEHTKVDEIKEKVAPSADYWKIEEPGGTWSCPLDGCSHQVWDAEGPTGRMLIKTHYAQTHQDSIEELIRSESRPWAKTGYLLDKVRGMRHAQALGDDEDEENGLKKGKGKNLVFPKPIKRVL